MTKWHVGKLYKFLHSDKKTIVIIELLSKSSSLYTSNKFFFNKLDSEYSVEFDKIFTGVSIIAEEITRKDVFIELFK